MNFTGVKDEFIMNTWKVFSLFSTGNLRLEVRFSTALAAPVNFVLWAVHDSAIKINRNRNVLLS